jgi:hypothetical protein
VRYATSYSIDKWEVPFVNIAHLSLKHGYVCVSGSVIEVNDDGQCVVLI